MIFKINYHKKRKNYLQFAKCDYNKSIRSQNARSEVKYLVNKTMRSLRGTKTRKQVALELNIPESTYAMIEDGRRFPRKDLLLKISKYFDVSIETLFFS